MLQTDVLLLDLQGVEEVEVGQLPGGDTLPGNEKTYPTDGKGKNIFPANFNGDMLVPWRAFILLLLLVLLVSNSFKYFFAALLILLAFIRFTPCTVCLFFLPFLDICWRKNFPERSDKGYMQGRQSGTKPIGKMSSKKREMIKQVQNNDWLVVSNMF